MKTVVSVFSIASARVFALNTLSPPPFPPLAPLLDREQPLWALQARDGGCVARGRLKNGRDQCTVSQPPFHPPTHPPTPVAPPVAVRFKDEAPPSPSEADASPPPSPSSSSDTSDDAPPPRVLSSTEASAQGDALDADPRFVLALDFVAAAMRSRALPEAPQRWTVDSLASDLVSCDAGPGTVLATLHTALIRGASPRAPVDGAKWPANVAERLKRAAALDGDAVADGVPPTLLVAKRAPVAYATATAMERVAFLLALCEVVAMRLWPALETAARSEATTTRAKRGRPAASSSDDDTDASDDDTTPLPTPPLASLLRRTPLGVDAAGGAFFFFDWGAHGVRLCRARPPSVKDVASATAAKRDAGALAPSAWETIARDGDGVRVAAAKLARSRLAADRALAMLLQRAALAADRADEAARVADRLARAGLEVTPSKLAAAVAAGPGLAVERARRTATKRVDYTFSGLDAAVRETTRRGGGTGDSDSDVGRRRRGPSPTRFETGAAAARAGLRRGRSAYDTVGPAAPDVGRLERAARAAAKKARRERRDPAAQEAASVDDDGEEEEDGDADNGVHMVQDEGGEGVGGTVVVEEGGGGDAWV